MFAHSQRYHNHLDPNVKKGGWSKEEDELILTLQKKYGNAWAKITSFLPGRTDNAVKNRYWSATRSKARKMKVSSYRSPPALVLSSSSSASSSEPSSPSVTASSAAVDFLSGLDAAPVSLQSHDWFWANNAETPSVSSESGCDSDDPDSDLCNFLDLDKAFTFEFDGSDLPQSVPVTPTNENGALW